MMVFYKARLVVLAVPKTGSTAYESALRDHADLVMSQPPELKHAPLYRYNRFIRPMYEKVCDAELEVMAVMREPVSWLGSWWRYRQRPFMKGEPNATHGISFDDFVAAYVKGQRPPFAEVGSQAKFLEPRPNGVGISHIFAYEDQDAIQSFLQERLGVDVQTKRENASPEIAYELSPEIERRYRKKCAAEFDLYASIERQK